MALMLSATYGPEAREDIAWAARARRSLPVPAPVNPDVSIPRLTARLTLRNTTDKAVTLQFSSGQRYDLELRNEDGGVVYRWSDDKAFTMALGQEVIGSGERDYVIVVRLVDKQVQPLAPGRYTAAGWITTSGQQPYKASVGFEIRHVY